MHGVEITPNRMDSTIAWALGWEKKYIQGFGDCWCNSEGEVASRCAMFAPSQSQFDMAAFVLPEIIKRKLCYSMIRKIGHENAMPNIEAILDSLDKECPDMGKTRRDMYLASMLFLLVPLDEVARAADSALRGE